MQLFTWNQCKHFVSISFAPIIYIFQSILYAAARVIFIKWKSYIIITLLSIRLKFILFSWPVRTSTLFQIWGLWQTLACCWINHFPFILGHTHISLPPHRWVSELLPVECEQKWSFPILVQKTVHMQAYILSLSLHLLLEYRGGWGLNYAESTFWKKPECLSDFCETGHLLTPPLRPSLDCNFA